MPDDVPPLSAAYIKRLLFCTVLIERFYQTHAGRPASDSASGIIIGKGTRFGPPHVNVATAAHVLEDTPTLPVRWCISRLDSLDGTVHVATFTTHKPIAEEPMLFRPKNPGDFDVAMISTFNRATVQRSKPARDVEFIDFARRHRLGTSSPGLMWRGPVTRVLYSNSLACTFSATTKALSPRMSLPHGRYT